MKKYWVLAALLSMSTSTFLHAESAMEALRAYKNGVEQAYILGDQPNLERYSRALSALILDGQVEDQGPKMKYDGTELPKQIKRYNYGFRSTVATEAEANEIYDALSTLITIGDNYDAVHPMFYATEKDTAHQKAAKAYYNSNRHAGHLKDLFDVTYNNMPSVDFENSTYVGQVNLQQDQDPAWKAERRVLHPWIKRFKVMAGDEAEVKEASGGSHRPVLAVEDMVQTALQMGTEQSVQKGLEAAPKIETMAELIEYLSNPDGGGEYAEFLSLLYRGTLEQKDLRGDFVFEPIFWNLENAQSEKAFIAAVTILDGMNNLAGPALTEYIKNKRSQIVGWTDYRTALIKRYLTKVDQHILSQAKEIFEAAGFDPIESSLALVEYILEQVSKYNVSKPQAVVVNTLQYLDDTSNVVEQAVANQKTLFAGSKNIFAGCKNIDDLLQRIDSVYKEAQAVKEIIETVPSAYNAIFNASRHFFDLASAASTLLQKPTIVDDWLAAAAVAQQIVKHPKGLEAVNEVLGRARFQIFDDAGLPYKNYNDLMRSIQTGEDKLRHSAAVLGYRRHVETALAKESQQAFLAGPLNGLLALANVQTVKYANNAPLAELSSIHGKVFWNAIQALTPEEKAKFAQTFNADSGFGGLSARQRDRVKEMLLTVNGQNPDGSEYLVRGFNQ